ncbi:MAG TPA: acyltransferase family protein [Chloroflexia bacterium]|nr:acyltransferase family protein [Chloroflexia bacterium]
MPARNRAESYSNPRSRAYRAPELEFRPSFSRQFTEINPHPAIQTGRMPALRGLDGLRALAVSAVLLYHAGVEWLPGGFLGVEVFFVISGFLITALLLEEWRQTGQVNLKRFWLRRARRLLPALFLLLGGTLTFALIFLPGMVAELRADVLAALTYITNWYQIFSQKSYFETVGRPSLLKHLWSLAVEEQFYLIWPLLFAAGMRYWGKRRLLVAVIAGAVLSSLLMALLYKPDVDPSRLYYGTDTRAAGLLIGAALALVYAPWRQKEFGSRYMALALNLLFVATMGGLFWFYLNVSEFESFLYQGGFALLALTTAMLIASVVHPLAQWGPYLLELKPLRWVGLRSYSIYLWHWPVFMLTRPQLDLPLDGLPLFVLRIILTGLLAAFSYRYIETPFRNGAFGQAWHSLRQARGVERQGLMLRWTGVSGVLAVGLAFVVAETVNAQPPAPPAYLSVTGVHNGVPVSGLTEDLVLAAALTPGANLVIPTLPPTIKAGQVANSRPVPTPTPPPASHITAVGDSVMVGAAKELGTNVGEIDIEATVGLQFADATRIIKAQRDSGQLGKEVLVHIGNNGSFNAKQFDEMMQIIGPERKVIFVNVKVPRPWENANNRTLAEGVARYPNAKLVDWRSASIGHPEFFWDDGIHLRPEGAKFYASLIAGYLSS